MGRQEKLVAYRRPSSRSTPGLLAVQRIPSSRYSSGIYLLSQVTEAGLGQSLWVWLSHVAQSTFTSTVVELHCGSTVLISKEWPTWTSGFTLSELVNIWIVSSLGQS